MPTYAYEAVDRKGQAVKNRVTAGSRDDALRNEISSKQALPARR